MCVGGYAARSIEVRQTLLVDVVAEEAVVDVDVVWLCCKLWWLMIVCVLCFRMRSAGQEELGEGRGLYSQRTYWGGWRSSMGFIDGSETRQGVVAGRATIGKWVNNSIEGVYVFQVGGRVPVEDMGFSE